MKKSQDLSFYTTLGLKSQGKLYLVETLSELKEILADLKEKKQSFRCLGMGSNLVLSPELKDVLIKINRDFSPEKEQFKELRPSYLLPANFPLHYLTSYAVKYALGGWEVFTGIPATIAGAVYMNAGTSLGEIGALIKKVVCINAEGEEVIYSGKDLLFSYRKNHFMGKNEVIWQVEIHHRGVDEKIPHIIKNYLKKRKITQPLKEKSCGSVFKNSISDLPSGKMIDLLNLKGLRAKDLSISHLHGNFFINRGNASKEDYLKLVECVQREVYLNYGISLETEAELF